MLFRSNQITVCTDGLYTGSDFSEDCVSRSLLHFSFCNSLPADEQKKKKRRLRRVSSLDRDIGTSVPAAEEVPMSEFIDADLNGCARSAADPNVGAPSVADPNGGAACVANEDDGEEEDEVPLTRKKQSAVHR